MNEHVFQEAITSETMRRREEIAKARGEAKPYFDAVVDLTEKHRIFAAWTLGRWSVYAPKLVSVNLVSVFAYSQKDSKRAIGPETNFVLFEMPTNAVGNYLENKNCLFVMPKADMQSNLYGKTYFGREDDHERRLNVPIVDSDKRVTERLSIQLRQDKAYHLFSVYHGKCEKGEGIFTAKIVPLYDRIVQLPFLKTVSEQIGEADVLTAQNMAGYLVRTMGVKEFEASLGIARGIVDMAVSK